MQARLWSSALIAIGIVFALLAPSLPNSFAHPIYIKSTPQAFQTVNSAPTEVNVFFTEPIEMKYSKIWVTNSDGSRVDNNDPHNVEGDTASIGVTLKPDLPDGIYTVSTNVLSAVDGHVLPNAFTFGVGVNVEQKPTTEQTQNLISLPEALSRYPGLIGQIMIVGGAFATLWLWKPLGLVPWLSTALAQKRTSIDKAMMKFIIIGVILVLAAGAAMIVVQANSIGGSIPDAIATKFGNIWITRMLQSSILLAIVVSLYRKMSKKDSTASKAELLAILVLGFAILVTSSLIAHAAATSQIGAIALDFFHDVAAAIWIGGLMLLALIVAPKILEIPDEKVKATAISILIPRFSIIVVTILGIVAITGPLLLYSIESDLSLTLASMYGQFLIVKLSLAGVMLGMGAYSQFAIQKKAVSVVDSGGTSMVQTRGGNLKHFGKFLKAEAAVGLGLLLMVSLMANSSVPSGQFPAYQEEREQGIGAAEASAQPPINTNFVETAYVTDGQIRFLVSPFDVGQNNFKISFINKDGNPVTDVNSATMTMTQTEKNIGPITIDAKKQSDGVFVSDSAFGVAGTWAIVIEGVRTQGSNMIATFDANVNPHVSNLDFALKQYNIYDDALPLYPLYDQQRQSIWIGDSMPGSGRILQFNIATGNYTAHEIKGSDLITITALAADGRIWYVEPRTHILGVLNPADDTTKQFKLPAEGIITGLTIDQNGNLWMPVLEPNKIVRFDPNNENFSSYDIPTPNSEPTMIITDSQGSIWFTEIVGKIANIDPTSGKITEYAPKGSSQALGEPTAIFQDPRRPDTLYISEHTGHTVTAFSKLLGTFHKYPSPNEAGAPFGMTMDKNGNLWVAEHLIDRIAVIDPRTGESKEVKIPISGSTIQYLVSDDTGKIWFAAQRGQPSLGSITTTAKPAPPVTNSSGGEDSSTGVTQLGFSFSQAAGPGIAVGIVISALFYAKASADLRRNMNAALRQKG